MNRADRNPWLAKMLLMKTFGGEMNMWYPSIFHPTLLLYISITISNTGLSAIKIQKYNLVPIHAFQSQDDTYILNMTNKSLL